MKLLNLLNYTVTRTEILDDWYDMLEDKKMTYDTIRGRLNNISVLIQLFQANLTNQKNNQTVDNFIKYCRIITKRCEYKTSEVISNITTTDYIDKGLLPKYLKRDLLKMWKMLLPLMFNIIQFSKSVKLRKTLYSLLLRCILFGFWAENSNGRMRAISTMTLTQYNHMCRKNYNSSSETKSIKQHGRQLVSLCTNSELLIYVKMYVKFVRPQIESNHTDKDYVFLK